MAKLAIFIGLCALDQRLFFGQCRNFIRYFTFRGVAVVLSRHIFEYVADDGCEPFLEAGDCLTTFQVTEKNCVGAEIRVAQRVEQIVWLYVDGESPPLIGKADNTAAVYGDEALFGKPPLWRFPIRGHSRYKAYEHGRICR